MRSVAEDILGTHIATNVPTLSTGFDSIAATEFVKSLSVQCGVEVSPTTLFDHPTLDSIASFIQEISRDISGTRLVSAKRQVRTSLCVSSQRRGTVITALSFQVAGSVGSDCELRSVAARALDTTSDVPTMRWVTLAYGASALAYGSFVSVNLLGVDASVFRIPTLEARSLDPQQTFVLEIGYATLIQSEEL